jgi:hypothetical protein
MTVGRNEARLDPKGVGDLTHVDAAVRVKTYCMGSHEIARCTAVGTQPSKKHIPVRVEDVNMPGKIMPDLAPGT